MKRLKCAAILLCAVATLSGQSAAQTPQPPAAPPSNQPPVHMRARPILATMNCKIFPDKPVNMGTVGVLIVDFKITVEGTVKDLTIKQSSGNDAYDRAVA